jgi:hypothetical protein
MNEKRQPFINRLISLRFLRYALYPITTLFTTPIRLVHSLWNCRILMNGQWRDYNNFSGHGGINNLFYWTQSVNIQRYGRHGVSKTLGLGNLSIGKLFHLTSFSLMLFHKLGGSMIMVIGMFGWLVAHLLWLSYSANSLYALVVLCLVLISTTFYGNLFDFQNYNVLGWLFFPVGLFGILTGNYFIASAAWLVVSFGSFTVFYFACWVALFVALFQWNWLVLFTIIPGLIKIATHFAPLLATGNLRGSINSIAKAIGVRGKAKYKRKLKLGFWELYFFGLWATCCVAIYLWSPPVLHLTALQQACLVGLAPFFWLLNSSISRFADHQSLYMLFLSVSTAVMMVQNHIALLPFYWIAISPHPVWLKFSSEQGVFDIVPKRKPFLIRPLIDAAESFLEPVPSGARILFAWNDPRGQYHSVFDGYRVLFELPLYVAARRKIHLFPDWYAVFETNYEGSPDFWGREVEQVIANIKKWKADFVIVYQEPSSQLHPKWEKHGFKRLSTFSWKTLEPYLRGQRPFIGDWVDWWLLKVPTDG